MPWPVHLRATAFLACLVSIVALGCVAVSSDERSPPITERPQPAEPRGSVAVAPPESEPPSLAPTGPTQIGHVVRITDGDTIRVLIDGQEHRLRYIGIDTPESVAPDSPVEPFAEAATAANARLVAGEEVVLERDMSETDRFDRLLRYVWLEPDLRSRATDDDAWRLVNLELVRIGLAEAVDYPPDVKYSAILAAAEAEARAAGRGMWATE